MSILVKLISDIEGAIGSGDSNRRAQTLRRVADLFIDNAIQIQGEQVDIFDQVVATLSREMDLPIRAEIAARFADIASAPRRTIAVFAQDDSLDVAGPVLERSPCVTEAVLIAVVTTKGQGHLGAVARRRRLVPRITDVIVERGDQTVVRVLARNPGAAFSDGGILRLVERSRPDEELQDALEKRRDLSAAPLKCLMNVVRERVRERLSQDLGPHASVEATIGDIERVRFAEAYRGPALSNFEASAAYMSQRFKPGSLPEAHVARWVKLNQIEDALAALAGIADIPLAFAIRAFYDSNPTSLLLIARASEFSWTTFKLLLSHRYRRDLSVDILTDSYDQFDRLSVPTSRRAVRLVVLEERVAEAEARVP